MSLYEVLLFVHVLAAAAWFGAALLAFVLLELAARANDTPWLVGFGDYDEKVAPLLFIPAAIVTLLAGVGLVLDGPWGFIDDGWVLAGLILFAAIFVLGIGLIVPTGKKMNELARREAPADEVQQQLTKLRVLSLIDVVLLGAAIFFMTTKPF